MARGARARRGIRADDARESETRSIRVVANDGGADGAERRPRRRAFPRRGRSGSVSFFAYLEDAEVRRRVQRTLLAEGTAEHVTRAMAETAGASPLVTHVEALNNKAGTRVPLARGSKRAG